MNVYIVVYTGSSNNQGNPVDWAKVYSECLMQSLTAGTAYHNYQNSLSTPYLQWQAILGSSGKMVHEIHLAVPQINGHADYGQIFDQVKNTSGINDDLCNLINNGTVQEVWLWADSNANFAEHVAIGPDNGYTAPPDYDDLHNVKDCVPDILGLRLRPYTQRQYTIMGLNFESQIPLSNAMESYIHHLERAFDALFPYEFDIPLKNAAGGDYWVDPIVVRQGVELSQNQGGSSRGFSARAHNIAETAECGLAHWSPNINLDTEAAEPDIEYDGYFRNDLMFRTGCDSWNPNPLIALPSATNILIDCTNSRAWRCLGGAGNKYPDKEKFYIWWMQNLPGAGNLLTHCTQYDATPGDPLGNWWAYLRGDLSKPDETNHTEWWCNPSSPPGTAAIPGIASVSGAEIKLYSLEAGGILIPVPLAQPIHTAADGSYIIPSLGREWMGKTLVIEANGGTIFNGATGKTLSFGGRSLYTVLFDLDLDRPLGGTVTPLTDLAFRLARRKLQDNPQLAPAQAAYFKLLVADQFGLKGYEGEPMDINLQQPADLYDGRSHTRKAQSTQYALALAGLSQQATDAGMAFPDWIVQLSADAADGKLDGTATSSARNLPAAIEKFLAQPKNPLPPKITP